MDMTAVQECFRRLAKHIVCDFRKFELEIGHGRQRHLLERRFNPVVFFLNRTQITFYAAVSFTNKIKLRLSLRLRLDIIEML